jgi:EAL domain-containing protein (putative c-di-GMP-specific phosphodiesterase class I)
MMRAPGTSLSATEQVALETRFEAALDSLWMAFQPIVATSAWNAHAYEALVRSEEPTLGHPAGLFAAADRLQRSHDLGRAIRSEVARSVALLPADAEIFVNLDASDLSDAQLVDKRNPLLPHARRIVFEITERASLRGISALDDTLRTLRSRGFRFAIDDLGAGYALSSLERVQPEYVKLDVSLVRNVHRLGMNRRLIESLAIECRGRNRQVVAEGVEQQAERDTLLELGCGFLQGFLFGRPSRLPLTA